MKMTITYLTFICSLAICVSTTSHASIYESMSPLTKDGSIVKSVALAKEAQISQYKKSQSSLLDQLIQDEKKLTNTYQNDQRILDVFTNPPSKITRSNPLSAFFQILFGS